MSRARTAGEQAPILYVLKRFPRLSETFILRELLTLESNGQPLAIDSLLPPEPQPPHPELADLRARVRYLPRHPRLRMPAVALAHLRVAGGSPCLWLRLARRARAAGVWRRFVQAGLVARRARQERARHIHAHFATAAAEVAGDAAALAGVPFTVTTHAKDIYQRENAALLRSRLVRAAAAVTISDFNARHLRESVPGLPVVHVPNGMAIAPPASIPADGPVLCVARLIPKKGVDLLIEACALLEEDLSTTRLEIIGGGPLAVELAELARRRGIGERVELRGAVSPIEVDRALRRCSLLALPCRIAADGDRDGIPTVLLEAMARGVPVVSTDVVGIPEIVHDGVTGLLVSGEDPAALADAIARLLRDRSLARALGDQGRSLVGERFDPQRSAQLLLELFAR